MALTGAGKATTLTSLVALYPDVCVLHISNDQLSVATEAVLFMFLATNVSVAAGATLATPKSLHDAN